MYVYIIRGGTCGSENSFEIPIFNIKEIEIVIDSNPRGSILSIENTIGFGVLLTLHLPKKKFW